MKGFVKIQVDVDDDGLQPTSMFRVEGPAIDIGFTLGVLAAFVDSLIKEQQKEFRKCSREHAAQFKEGVAEGRVATIQSRNSRRRLEELP